MAIFNTAREIAVGIVNGASVFNSLTSLPGQGVGYLAGKTVGAVACGIGEMGRYLRAKASRQPFQRKPLSAYTRITESVGMTILGTASTLAFWTAIPIAGFAFMGLGGALGIHRSMSHQPPKELHNPFKDLLVTPADRDRSDSTTRDEGAGRASSTRAYSEKPVFHKHPPHTYRRE